MDRAQRWCRTAIVLAALTLAPGLARGQNEGLRFLGDARIAVGTNGGVVGGPALRFRYGARYIHRKEADSVPDWLVGSWAGIEVSAGLLVGAPEPGELGAVTLVGARPWLSRKQSKWFLRTERFCVLGALLPEVGVALGAFGGPVPYLGWDLPFGSEHVHLVPGVVWFSPRQDRLPVYLSLALRVPM